MSFFRKKPESLVKTTLERIKICKNKKSTLARQFRNDAAQLLSKGHYDKAAARVELVFKEENMVATYELLDGYCQLFIFRVDKLKSHKECPTDLKGVIATILYAAPRCGDLPELQDIRTFLRSTYGDEFCSKAVNIDNQPNLVDQKIITSLSTQPPSQETKINLLKAIAAEHKITWNSALMMQANAKSKMPSNLLKHQSKESPTPTPSSNNADDQSAVDRGKNNPTITTQVKSMNDGIKEQDQSTPQIKVSNMPSTKPSPRLDMQSSSPKNHKASSSNSMQSASLPVYNKSELTKNDQEINVIDSSSQKIGFKVIPSKNPSSVSSSTSHTIQSQQEIENPSSISTKPASRRSSITSEDMAQSTPNQIKMFDHEIESKVAGEHHNVSRLPAKVISMEQKETIGIKDKDGHYKSQGSTNAPHIREDHHNTSSQRYNRTDADNEMMDRKPSSRTGRLNLQERKVLEGQLKAAAEEAFRSAMEAEEAAIAAEAAVVRASPRKAKGNSLWPNNDVVNRESEEMGHESRPLVNMPPGKHKDTMATPKAKTVSDIPVRSNHKDRVSQEREHSSRHAPREKSGNNRKVEQDEDVYHHEEVKHVVYDNNSRHLPKFDDDYSGQEFIPSELSEAEGKDQIRHKSSVKPRTNNAKNYREVNKVPTSIPDQGHKDLPKFDDYNSDASEQSYEVEEDEEMHKRPVYTQRKNALPAAATARHDGVKPPKYHDHTYSDLNNDEEEQWHLAGSGNYVKSQKKTHGTRASGIQTGEHYGRADVKPSTRIKPLAYNADSQMSDRHQNEYHRQPIRTRPSNPDDDFIDEFYGHGQVPPRSGPYSSTSKPGSTKPSTDRYGQVIDMKPGSIINQKAPPRQAKYEHNPPHRPPPALYAHEFNAYDEGKHEEEEEEEEEAFYVRPTTRNAKKMMSNGNDDIDNNASTRQYHGSSVNEKRSGQRPTNQMMPAVQRARPEFITSKPRPSTTDYYDIEQDEEEERGHLYNNAGREPPSIATSRKQSYYNAGAAYDSSSHGMRNQNSVYPGQESKKQNVPYHEDRIARKVGGDTIRVEPKPHGTIGERKLKWRSSTSASSETFQDNMPYDDEEEEDEEEELSHAGRIPSTIPMAYTSTQGARNDPRGVASRRSVRSHPISYKPQERSN